MQWLLVHRFGKPDIFLTMTCNSEWQEITFELKPWEKAFNRLDLVARIFQAKIRFGSVAAYEDVIEFQKRGLPQAHSSLYCSMKTRF